LLKILGKKGIAGLVGLRLFKNNALLLDPGSFHVGQIPANREFAAAQVARRSLLTWGSYLLRAVD